MIAIAKDEGPWLLEWVAHNVAIGFNRIVVATNDCTDGTDEMLDRLTQMGVLRHIRNYPPYGDGGTKVGLQRTAYEKARRLPEVANATWVMPLDVDEFLNIKLPGGRIGKLIDRMPEACDAITFCWRVFGSGGTQGWIDGPLCETLVHAASLKTNVNMVKTMVRNHHTIPRIAAHGPMVPEGTPEEALPSMHPFLPHGEALPPERLVRPGNAMHQVPKTRKQWSVAQINHYMIKNRDMFELKRLRGAASRPDERAAVTRYSDGSMEKYDRNEVVDRSIKRTQARRDAVRQEFLADPLLGKLHRESSAHAKAQLAEMMARRADATDASANAEEAARAG